MKSILLICLILASSVANMGATLSTGPEFEGFAFEFLAQNLDNLKDLDIVGEYDGNFFGNLWQFIEGFLQAIGYNSVVTSETDCNQYAHAFVGAVESTFENFLNGKIPAAIIQYKKAAKNYNGTVFYCNQTFIEFGRFFDQIGYNWKQAVDTGFGLKRLILNRKQVNTDLANGKTALQNKDYFSAGSNYGNILSIFLYGNNTEAPVLEQAQPEVLLVEEHKQDTKNTYDSVVSNPLMSSVINHLVSNAQGKNIIEGILNIASSYMGPALNVYDTDDLN